MIHTYLQAASRTLFLLMLAGPLAAQFQYAPSGRNLGAPAELEFLDQFVGVWNLHPVGVDSTTPPAARIEARYILDGTMLQADYRALNPAGTPVFWGTSLRTWDPRAGRFSVKWAPAFSKGYTLIEAWVEDGELRSTGVGEDQGGPFLERYRFFDFTSDSFKFEMDRSRDDGATWARQSYMHYRRVN